MAKRLKGSTTKAGSSRTQRPAQDVNARIEGPHSGGNAKRVGPQTAAESKALRGIPGEGKVKNVGPETELRSSGSVGSSGSVKSVGKENFEDRLAAQGGDLRTPQTRQSGAVKQVGPLDRGYEKLTENAMPATQTQQARFSPKRGSRIDKGIPLLKSGVGRAHAWSVYSGQPGTQGLGGARRAFTSDSLLINGRRRVFGPEPFPARRDLVKPAAVVLPGGTRIY